MSLRIFLEQLKTSHLPRVLGSPSKLKIVYGNESADMDSVASAITYAYFNYVYDPTQLVIPIINIPRCDLPLRRDILFALDKISITEDLLYFNEDLNKFIQVHEAGIETVLVDHNDLPKLDGIRTVVGVIDHHADLGLYKDASPRVIRPTGSCSSLVFNYWIGLIKGWVRMKDAIPLSMAALVILSLIHI